MKFKQIKEEFGNLKSSAERLQSLVSNYSNAMLGDNLSPTYTVELCKASGELVNGIQEYYKDVPITLVGDVLIPKLQEGIRSQENMILPVV